MMVVQVIPDLIGNRKRHLKPLCLQRLKFRKKYPVKKQSSASCRRRTKGVSLPNCGDDDRQSDEKRGHQKGGKKEHIPEELMAKTVPFPGQLAAFFWLC